MFDVIRKVDYWDALNDPFVSAALGRYPLAHASSLKHIQQAWMLHKLKPERQLNILEIGGKQDWVLAALHNSNERWRIKPSNHSQPTSDTHASTIDFRTIPGKLGAFSPELPDDYFDIVFSISVVDRVWPEYLSDFFADQARVMKHGGIAYHAIDIFVGDESVPRLELRIDRYLESMHQSGLTLIDPISLVRPVRFNCAMASNSNFEYWYRRRQSQIFPYPDDDEGVHQFVSLVAIMQKAR